jgi:hypothetical protein
MVKEGHSLQSIPVLILAIMLLWFGDSADLDFAHYFEFVGFRQAFNRGLS